MPEQNDLSNTADTLKDQLAFTCAYEADRIPPRDPEADQLFKRARWMQKKNLIKKDLSLNPIIERLYRIAAAWGHDKANHNLALMMKAGESIADDYVTLPVDLAQELIDRGIPQGYYDMGSLLYSGYGVEEDQVAALKYFRKAADLGSPEAQYYIGDQLTQFTIFNPVPYEIGHAMKRCAGEQGHGEAAYEAADQLQDDVLLRNKGNLADALKYFQLAVKAGNSTAASKLEDSFLAPPPTDTLDYLGLEKDEERSRRYGILMDILGNYSYLHPTVDEIDDIVPLPPAPLPPWDEKIQFQKDWESADPPPVPSAERIAEMAREKGLDPRTGRKPPPPEPQAEAPKPPARYADTGDPCPRSGLWCSIENPQKVLLEAGQPMPNVAYNRRSPHPLGRLLGLRRTEMGPGHWEWLGNRPEGGA